MKNEFLKICLLFLQPTRVTAHRKRAQAKGNLSQDCQMANGAKIQIDLSF